MAKSVVAIVGRPNVGKSTLFNKLIGSRLSIVDDTPGVTRDRIYGDCEWLNNKFLLVDTGGIEPNTNDIILSQMRSQAEIAIETADVIILVTNLRDGVVASDHEVASMLQKSGKPIILCVNKCDSIGAPDPEFYEFYNLGMGDPIAVSATHGHGTGDLLDEVIKFLPEQTEEEDDDEIINVAIIGKPNVGKSSLVNKISGANRAIVSDIAGTTRDTTDTFVENQYGKFNFIDTAGLRRKSKVNDAIEKFSIIRARMAVERANVCVIMIDAVEGFTEQDSKVAGIALEQGKACIIAVNKWDAVEKDGSTMNEYRKKLETKMAEVLADTSIDENRIAAEVILYADKICVDEETVRLRSHIAHARQCLSEDGGIGRKLDFIAQEMNREANTTLSKANDIEISNAAIDLKTEIEKVREQIQNIE